MALAQIIFENRGLGYNISDAINILSDFLDPFLSGIISSLDIIFVIT